MKKWFITTIAMLMLTACGDHKEEVENTTEVIEEGTVGFGMMMGGKIEEAANIPEGERERVIGAFEEYIAALNEGDIDRYSETLSKEPHGFDYEEDIKAVKKIIASQGIQRQASDVTIVKYSEDEAQVFSNIDTTVQELETGVEQSYSGRQVTVFAKEEGAWKVSIVKYMGNE